MSGEDMQLAIARRALVAAKRSNKNIRGALQRVIADRNRDRRKSREFLRSISKKVEASAVDAGERFALDEILFAIEDKIEHLKPIDDAVVDEGGEDES